MKKSLDWTIMEEFVGRLTDLWENENWQKVNHHDKTNGLSQKAVNAYRREHPGSKLKTAVTTKPSKLKKGSKAAKRRKSFCARMSGNKGPMKKPNGKPTPKALALRRWNCESIEQMANMIARGERMIAEMKQQQLAEGQEKFNIALMKPGFRWSEEINGITYLVRTQWDNMPEVIARVNNREVGRATFIDHHTRSGLESVSTYVSPKWQGHGIAKNMYAVIRMLGANIQPSATQTAMGKDMWAKWKKGGDTKHLTSMNAKMDQQGVAEAVPTQAGAVDPKIQFLQPTIQFAEKLGYRVTINPNPNGKIFAKLVNKQIEHIVRIGFSRGRDPGTKLEADMSDNWDSQTYAWSAKELAQDFKEFYKDALRDSPTQGQQGVAEGGGAQQAAIAIAKKASGKYTKDGSRKK